MANREQWRDIAGFEGIYQVSDHGRVRSLDRVDCRGRRLKGVDMKPPIDRDGYARVGLYRDGRGTLTYVHRLVLEAFVGPCPEEYEACHHDGNPANNRLSNLRWDTKKANAADRTRHGTAFLPIGERHGMSKLNDDVVVEARRTCRTGADVAAIARREGVGYGALSHAVAGYRWPHLNDVAPPVDITFAKLTADIVVQARRQVRAGASVADVAAATGVSLATLQSAVTGRSWPSVDHIEPPVALSRRAALKAVV